MASPRTRRRARSASAERLGVDYTRFSTDLQDSTEDQRAINHEVAFDEQIRIVAHFEDEAVSRSLSDRKGLRELFDYLREHTEVGYLIVNELERLTAGIAQRQEVVTICKTLDITIVTSDMGMIDPHDADKMHEADQRAVSSEGEVLRVSKRTKRNLRAKVRAKSTVAMRPAFGVRMKPLVLPSGEELPSGMSMVNAQGKRVRSGQLELHPVEYPWLVKIFEWAHEGMSSDAIAKRLTAEGVRTKSGNVAWRGNTINGILDNPFYKGEMTWGLQATIRDAQNKKRLEVRDENDPGRLTFDSPLGAIIPVEQWDAIHAARQQRLATKMMTRRAYDKQVFDNLVYCGRCGHRMYGRTDNPGRGRKLAWRYYCYSKRVGYQPLPEYGVKCADAHSMSLKHVLQALAGMGPADAKVTVISGGGKKADDREGRERRIKARIEAARTEYATAQEMTKRGLMSFDECAEALAERDATIAAAEADLQTVAETPEPTILPFEGEVAGLFQVLAEKLGSETLTLQDKLDALDEIGLERIYLDKPGLRLHLRD